MEEHWIEPTWLRPDRDYCATQLRLFSERATNIKGILENETLNDWEVTLLRNEQECLNASIESLALRLAGFDNQIQQYERGNEIRSNLCNFRGEIGMTIGAESHFGIRLHEVPNHVLIAFGRMFEGRDAMGVPLDDAGPRRKGE